MAAGAFPSAQGQADQPHREEKYCDNPQDMKGESKPCKQQDDQKGKQNQHIYSLLSD
jgi:hypothetical protein